MEIILKYFKKLIFYNVFTFIYPYNLIVFMFHFFIRNFARLYDKIYGFYKIWWLFWALTMNIHSAYAAAQRMFEAYESLGMYNIAYRTPNLIFPLSFT